MYQQITIIGRLGADPELRYTPSGVPVCSFSVATDKTWTNDQGQKTTGDHLASRCCLAQARRSLRAILEQGQNGASDRQRQGARLCWTRWTNRCVARSHRRPGEIFERFCR